MADEPLELAEGYRPPAPQTPEPPRRPVEFKPLPAPPPRRGLGLGKLFWVLLLGVGAYGGYYGFCRYKVSELERAFSEEMQDFRQKLIRKMANVNRDDVTRVVREAAGKIGVALEGETQVTFEPLTPANTNRLPSFAQSALGLAASIPGEKKQLYLVGYRVRALARHSVAKRVFEAEQHTYLEEEWVGR